MNPMERLRAMSVGMTTDAEDHAFAIASLSSSDIDTARTATEVAAELVAAHPALLSERLLRVITDSDADPLARSNAAIAFGPALEISDMEGFENPQNAAPFDRALYDRVVATLRTVVEDPEVPSSVRRASLEAAVRAIEPGWLVQAVRDAFSSKDSGWLETALFCSRYVDTDFTAEILASLNHNDDAVVYAAVFAAVDIRLPSAALRRIAGIADDPDVNIVVRCSALEALAAQPTKEAEVALEGFVHSDDDIVADRAAYLISWRHGDIEHP